MDNHPNPEQLSAITHGTGPLLIIAGAGTGKTSVITERVKHLINQNFATPAEILCLTFTEKAATEMETRIDIALPLGYSQLWVTTFHSFCDRVLRDESLNIGLDPSYQLLSDTSSVALLEKHLYKLPLDYYRPLGNPQKFLLGLLQHMSRLKDEDITPSQFLSYAESVEDPDEKKRYQELANLYLAYEDLKIQNSLMDFSDLISHTISLFRTRPNILKIYQQKFKYILVDEYQDTNYAQNILVNYLAGTDQNLTVVADDDQAIYRWRGAAVSNVLEFQNTYPTSKLVVLTKNYRSTQTILDSSYKLIQHNNPDRLEVKAGINKHLTSTREEIGESVKFLHAKTVDQEADLVTQKIQELLTSSAYSLVPGDFAILVRANAHALPFVKSLTYAGIPHQFLGPAKLFQTNEVRDLLAYLQVLNNYTDNQAAYRVLSQPFFALSGRDLAAVTTLAKVANLTLFESTEVLLEKLPVPNGVTIPQVSSTGLESLDLILTHLHRHLAQLSQSTTGQIIYDFLERTGMLKSMLEFKEPFTQEVAENVIKFFNIVKTFESIHPNALLPEVISWLSLSAELGDSSTSGLEQSTDDSVKILTIHASKGLEFPVVFVVNLVSQRFPSIARREQIPIPDALIKESLTTGDFHLQEERRLFYVALTRAKDHLFLTAADFYEGGLRQKKLSPFIYETLGDISSLSESQRSKNAVTASSTPASSKPRDLTISYLSYSQIQTFEVCPLHYKAKYILGIPTPPSAASSFGNTIHLTLKNFYSQLARLKPIPPLNEVKSFLLTIYQSVWTPVGYIHKNQAEEYFKKGQDYLTSFLDTNFNPNYLPHSLELPFTVPILSMDGTKQMKIGGKMDRVDVLPDGQIVIYDYKTSKEPMDQKEADTSLQLSFYALAATSLATSPFPISPEKLILKLHYFETGTTIATSRSLSDLALAKEKIFSLAEEISQSDFKCSASPLCRRCDFQLLCQQ